MGCCVFIDSASILHLSRIESATLRSVSTIPPSHWASRVQGKLSSFVSEFRRLFNETKQSKPTASTTMPDTSGRPRIDLDRVVRCSECGASCRVRCMASHLASFACHNARCGLHSIRSASVDPYEGVISPIGKGKSKSKSKSKSDESKSKSSSSSSSSREKEKKKKSKTENEKSDKTDRERRRDRDREQEQPHRGYFYYTRAPDPREQQQQQKQKQQHQHRDRAGFPPRAGGAGGSFFSDRRDPFGGGSRTGPNSGPFGGTTTTTTSSPFGSRRDSFTAEFERLWDSVAKGMADIRLGGGHRDRDRDRDQDRNRQGSGHHGAGSRGYGNDGYAHAQPRTTTGTRGAAARGRRDDDDDGHDNNNNMYGRYRGRAQREQEEEEMKKREGQKRNNEPLYYVYVGTEGPDGEIID